MLLQGLSDEYDLKKIIKVAKKEFACNGTVVDHAEYGEVSRIGAATGYNVVTPGAAAAGRPAGEHLQAAGHLRAGQAGPAQGSRLLSLSKCFREDRTNREL